jgi:hypothetical protein
MNPNILFEIAELALSVARTQGSEKVQQDAALAGILLKIIEKTAQAYQDHTGETLDPSLIKAEPGI